MPAAETVQVATFVPTEFAEELRQLAQQSERSVAAEIRLALRAWVDTNNERQAG